MKKWLVYKFDSGINEVGISHGTINLESTLCGLICAPGWITADEWADGPECKRCKRMARDTLTKLESWKLG